MRGHGRHKCSADHIGIGFLLPVLQVEAVNIVNAGLIRGIEQFSAGGVESRITLIIALIQHKGHLPAFRGNAGDIPGEADRGVEDQIIILWRPAGMVKLPPVDIAGQLAQFAAQKAHFAVMFSPIPATLRRDIRQQLVGIQVVIVLGAVIDLALKAGFIEGEGIEIEQAVAFHHKGQALTVMRPVGMAGTQGAGDALLLFLFQIVEIEIVEKCLGLRHLRNPGISEVAAVRRPTHRPGHSRRDHLFLSLRIAKGFHHQSISGKIRRIAGHQVSDLFAIRRHPGVHIADPLIHEGLADMQIGLNGLQTGSVCILKRCFPIAVELFGGHPGSLFHCPVEGKAGDRARRAGHFA